MGRSSKNADRDPDNEKTMEKLTVLVDSEILNELYAIMGREGIKNISELTRLALADYINVYKDENREDSMLIVPPPKIMDAVSNLVELGEFNNKDQVVEYALRKYIEEYKTKYLQEYKEYDEEVEKEKRKKAKLEVMV